MNEEKDAVIISQNYIPKKMRAPHHAKAEWWVWNKKTGHIVGSFGSFLSRKACLGAILEYRYEISNYAEESRILWVSR